MEYKELAKLYHMDASHERDANVQGGGYERRYSSASTFRTGFVTPNGELFVALPRELSLLSGFESLSELSFVCSTAFPAWLAAPSCAASC